jgi:hypothetical protein
MGGPNDYLVPAVILYENPQGLTISEFLKKTQNAVRKRGGSSFNWMLNDKIYGIGRIFNLPTTREYQKIIEESWDDEFDLRKKHLSQEGRKIRFMQWDYHLTGESIVETTHYDELDVEKETFWGGYKVKDYLDSSDLKSDLPREYQRSGIELRVKDVLDTSTIILQKNGAKIIQKMNVEIIDNGEIVQEFDNEKQFLKKYPEYSPERLFDFSQTQGFLFPYGDKGINSSIGKEKTFRWFRQENKYFLDSVWMMDNLSFDSGALADYSWRARWKKKNSVFSWTDFILTSEAIRMKKKSYLGDNSSDKMILLGREMLHQNLTTLQRYEKAVFDVEMSRIANDKGITNMEFLRMYSEMYINREISQQDFEKRRKEVLLKEKRDRIRERKNRKQIELAKEVPFN